MNRFFSVVFMLLLAACALPVAEPATVRLSQRAVTVFMSTGSSCTAELVGNAPWSGDLPDCGLRFVVTPTASGSPVRLAFDAMIAALRAGDLVVPMADIALTDGAGKVHRFTSPVPFDG